MTQTKLDAIIDMLTNLDAKLTALEGSIRNQDERLAKYHGSPLDSEPIVEVQMRSRPKNVEAEHNLIKEIIEANQRRRLGPWATKESTIASKANCERAYKMIQNLATIICNKARQNITEDVYKELNWNTQWGACPENTRDRLVQELINDIGLDKSYSLHVCPAYARFVFYKSLKLGGCRYYQATAQEGNEDMETTSSSDETTDQNHVPMRAKGAPMRDGDAIYVISSDDEDRDPIIGEEDEQIPNVSDRCRVFSPFANDRGMVLLDLEGSPDFAVGDGDVAKDEDIVNLDGDGDENLADLDVDGDEDMSSSFDDEPLLYAFKEVRSRRIIRS
ncbi:hypothetical protein BC940DRAFT_314465 [Gongronella butleri]|nr:hypothetical protein BC940DRAFT_314465 [Gongronella butleri]